MADKTIRVYPSSKLSPVEYVAGVGADGAELTEAEAKPMLDAGIVVKNKPAGTYLVGERGPELIHTSKKEAPASEDKEK